MRALPAGAHRTAGRTRCPLHPGSAVALSFTPSFASRTANGWAQESSASGGHACSRPPPAGLHQGLGGCDRPQRRTGRGLDPDVGGAMLSHVADALEDRWERDRDPLAIRSAMLEPLPMLLLLVPEAKVQRALDAIVGVAGFRRDRSRRRRHARPHRPLLAVEGHEEAPCVHSVSRRRRPKSPHGERHGPGRSQRRAIDDERLDGRVIGKAGEPRERGAALGCPSQAREAPARAVPVHRLDDAVDRSAGIDREREAPSDASARVTRTERSAKPEAHVVTVPQPRLPGQRRARSRPGYAEVSPI